MAILATNEGSGQNRMEPIESGTHIATCVQMVHIGTVEDEFDGKPVKGNKVRLTFELPNELVKFKEDEPEQPRFISKEFTLSLNEKATLRKFLDSWRGVPFTEDEAKSFDITKLLGVSCMLSITIKKSKKSGNAYNDILSASKLMKGTEAPQILTEVIEVNYQNISETYSKVPNFIREKMVLTPEYANCGFVFPTDNETPSNEPETETIDDAPQAEGTKKDLPF
jgi:hypothetical protein